MCKDKRDNIIKLHHKQLGVCFFDQWGNIYMKNVDSSPAINNDKLERRKDYKLTIQIMGNSVWESDCTHNILRLMKSMGDVLFEIEFFIEDDFNWMCFSHFVDSIKIANINYTAIVIEGKHINKDYLDFISRNRIIIRWPFTVTSENKTLNNTDLQNLRNIVEYGIFVPVRIYTNGLNKEHLIKLIKQILPIQLFCGLDVLPIFLKINYCSQEIISDFDNMSTEYCELLSNLLSEDIGCNIASKVEPVYGIADAVFTNGWCITHNIPQNIKILFNSSCELKIYRKLPCLAKKWRNAKAICVDYERDYSRDFFRFVQRYYTSTIIDKNKCCFKFICGCSESFNHKSFKDIHSYICEYHKFFIETFLWQKYLQCVK